MACIHGRDHHGTDPLVGKVHVEDTLHGRGHYPIDPEHGGLTEQAQKEIRQRIAPVVLVDYRRRPYSSPFAPGFRVTFDAETQNPAEMQRSGWQAILDNFKRLLEGRQ